MADLPSSIDKMDDVEIGNRKPLSETFHSKVGQNINALIDLAKVNVVEYTSGSGTYVVPDGVTLIYVFGCGAGGGGGASATGNVSGGGGGGGGAFGWYPKVVTPGQNISYSVGLAGAGGVDPSGSGVDGGDTTFDNFLFRGGKGGVGGTFGTAGAGGLGGVIKPLQGADGGAGSIGGATSANGERTVFAVQGNGGVPVGGSGAGGGGGAGVGVGGTAGTNGGGGAGGTGAGGGGASDGAGSPKDGGSGGGGLIQILEIKDPDEI